MPHSEEVEAAIVSRLLVDPAQLPVLGGRLAAADFYTTSWRSAYAAMQKLSAEQKSVDIIALQSEIGDAADEIGRRLGEITAQHRAPLDEYATIIRSYAFRRRLIDRLESVVTKAYFVSDPEQLLAELHEAAVAASEGSEDSNLLSPDAATDLYTASLKKRSAGGRGGLSWPLAAMDDLLLPAAEGEMIVIAARPSVGKTALAEQIGDWWASQAPYPILFASLEMTVDQLLDRSISRITGIPLSEIVQGILTDKDEDAVMASLAERRKGRLWYLDDPYATTSSVRAAAAKVRLLGGGVSGIVIDYLQLLKDPGDQEVQRVTKISRQVKALAREFRCPVLVLSQLNRAVTARDDQRPRLHDLRESGAIEQDADRVIGLARPLGKGETNLEVLKARQGRVGDVQLWFDGPHVRFQEPAEIIAEEVADAEEENEEFFDQFART